MQGNILLLILILWPICTSIIGYILGTRSKTARDIWADAVCLSEFAVMAGLLIRAFGGGDTLYLDIDGVCGLGIHLMADGFRCVYGTVAALMWACAAVFSREYFTQYRNRNRFYMFFLMTFGATMGVFLSADLFTAFIFFEIMSFTSFVWVAHDETEEAMSAAYTYLAVAIIGGLVTLMGLFMLYDMLGTLTLSQIPSEIEKIRNTWPKPYITEYGGAITPSRLYLVGGLTAFGFAVKAGVWPMHIWLPKAHPVAPASSSALLSGILTKSGIFGIIAITCNMFAQDIPWGRTILILGAVTMFTGALLAMFSVNLKRTLACSSMSQIGFIMTGTGMYPILSEIAKEESVMAAHGTVLHMINHSLIKLVLFMAAGVIFMNIHKLDLNEIRGYGRKKPLLKICFAIGALSISGIPFTSGYVSKTLLHEAIALGKEASIISRGMGLTGLLSVIEWVFLISGGMTLSYMLKLFIAIFVEKNTDERLQEEYDSQRPYMRTESVLSIVIPAGIMLLMGLGPNMIMGRTATLCEGFWFAGSGTADQLVIHFYSWESISGALISITIGLFLYVFVIRGTYINEGRILSVFLAEHSLFIRSDNEGRNVYVNMWPKFLDLEELIYRPLLLKILPGILGFVSALISQIMDSFIVIMRRTIHRQKATRVDTGSMDDHLAVVTGRLLDRYIPKKDKTSYIPGLVMREEQGARTQRLISSSLSFGLILVSIGLIMVLIYTLAAT
ncbi:MAG: sodium:proton antiporter [Lachnospiraceae bacterium]|nr:sodium:proton antiporter [Lachnospiraceae bacterium]